MGPILYFALGLCSRSWAKSRQFKRGKAVYRLKAPLRARKYNILCIRKYGMQPIYVGTLKCKCSALAERGLNGQNKNWNLRIWLL
jgi:hypothetical protein